MLSRLNLEMWWHNGQIITTVFISLMTFVGVVFTILQWHDAHNQRKSQVSTRISTYDVLSDLFQCSDFELRPDGVQDESTVCTSVAAKASTCPNDEQTTTIQCRVSIICRGQIQCI
jgi:hypothetical protein